MRICKKCIIEKNESEFYAKDLSCKSCKREKRRELKRLNPEKYYGLCYIKEKICTVCGVKHKSKGRLVCSMKCLIRSKVKIMNKCWIWQGSLNEHGYGKMTIQGRQYFSHRISFEESKKKIPQNLCILHSCDNPQCVNPDHLFLGTRADNAKDMYFKKRNRCQKGEERFCAKLTEKNVQDIKQMLKSGKKQQEISNAFQVHNSTISNIKNKKIWKHME